MKNTMGWSKLNLIYCSQNDIFKLDVWKINKINIIIIWVNSINIINDSNYLKWMLYKNQRNPPKSSTKQLMSTWIQDQKIVIQFIMLPSEIGTIMKPSKLSVANQLKQIIQKILPFKLTKDNTIKRHLITWESKAITDVMKNNKLEPVAKVHI